MSIDPNTHLLLSKHRGNGVLIDTNLLLLLLVGTHDRRRISSFKRTLKYTQYDYQRLAWFSTQFRVHWTTPNILTEVDNLGRQLRQDEWKNFSVVFSKFAGAANEIHLSSAEAAGSNNFARLGLADTVTIELRNKLLILTDDLPLSVAAQRSGLDALNFNHIRN